MRFIDHLMQMRKLELFFLDISHAFDPVWHEGLIHKLNKLGVDGEMINILTSFLANRMQRTTIDGKYSEWAGIRAGVHSRAHPLPNLHK